MLRLIRFQGPPGASTRPGARGDKQRLSCRRANTLFSRLGEGDDPLPAGGFFGEGSYYRDPSRGNCFGVDPAVHLTTHAIEGDLGTTCVPTDPQLVDNRLTPGNYLGARDPTGEDWLRWMR